MKTLLTLFIIAISLISYGQTPEAFKYQAVVRDAGGAILTNQNVGYQLTILQGTPTGTAVYTETFSPVTNAYGLVNIEIGTGTTTDDFSLIDWANGPYFIETAVDVSGGTSYSVMGTSQLVSVPYALHAKSADNVVNDAVDDADNDPNNEIQDINLAGTDLSITNGSTVDLSVIQDGTTDADADPTNELQVLSLSNDTLYLSNGNNVFLGNVGLGSSGNTRFEIFESSGSFTVPPGVDQIIVEVWGAGGGGARWDGMTGGAGGGGGGYGKDFINVTSGTTYSVNIGTGGAGANTNGGSGQDGGDSDFGGLISATGGSGGVASASGGGAGGTSSARIAESGVKGSNPPNSCPGTGGLAGGMANTLGRGGTGANAVSCTVNSTAQSGNDGMIIVTW